MKICLTCLFVCLSLSSAVLAQDQGPLLVRFPYRPETREEPVFNLRQLLSEVRPTVFSPQNYTLPDHILFSPAEQVWVDQLREGFDLVQDGDFLSAKDIFTAFLEEYPEHVPSRIALADILYSLGDLPAAEAAYRALLSEYPNHFQALNNLAWMYSTSTDEAFRRPDEARELVRRAMVTAPQSHHVWSTLSQTLFAQGRFEEAAQAAATAVNLAQRGGAATDVLVNYLLQLDRTRAAIQATRSDELMQPSPPMFDLRFLGTGWSHGVPMLACDCPVCLGNHPRNRRRRPSLQVLAGGMTAVIDTGPDFRDQALTFGITRLDAVFMTHEHADHVMGLDDVRRFTWARTEPLPIYADPVTLERLRIVYPYVSEVRIPGKAVPKIRFVPWESPVEVAGVRYSRLDVPHADNLPCCGVLLERGEVRVAYIPDCNDLPGPVKDRIRDADVLILNALRHRPHPAHLTLERSLELLKELNPRRGYITHMGCDFDYPALNPGLPEGIEMAYDGLRIGVSSSLRHAGQRV